ncbi:MAG TPA: hypothetical protein VGX78_02990 [Pirellulales bacterium]|jgi:hypothetical protein|nr:hypothetical protein [Pirellulales bacterium]
MNIDSFLEIEEIREPDLFSQRVRQGARAKLNRDWLSAHWTDVLPAARGRFLAVAGQEAFIADTARQAWDLAGAAHPEDDGAICQYIYREVGPRIYGNCR